MKRSLQEINEMSLNTSEVADTAAPESKRARRQAQVSGQGSEDTAAALLLSLASFVRQRSVLSKEPAEHPIVSDDEDDASVYQEASRRTFKPSCESTPSSRALKSFSRPLGPPPRLPRVPAGFIFSSRRRSAVTTRSN